MTSIGLDHRRHVTLREVAFGSADYRELLTLRNEVLRKPIGMAL